MIKYAKLARDVLQTIDIGGQGCVRKTQIVDACIIWLEKIPELKRWDIAGNWRVAEMQPMNELNDFYSEIEEKAVHVFEASLVREVLQVADEAAANCIKKTEDISCRLVLYKEQLSQVEEAVPEACRQVVGDWKVSSLWASSYEVGKKYEEAEKKIERNAK